MAQRRPGMSKVIPLAGLLWPGPYQDGVVGTGLAGRTGCRTLSNRARGVGGVVHGLASGKDGWKWEGPKQEGRSQVSVLSDRGPAGLSDGMCHSQRLGS